MQIVVPTVVYLPGAGGRGTFWRPVADRLLDLGPAVVLDYPGFGGLPPEPRIGSLDDLHAWVLERLPPGASHVVAQSMGGVLAARLAIERPERVDRLVLVATSGGVAMERLGGADWRPGYLATFHDVPRWFVDDRTDLTARLPEVRARTLLLSSDADAVSPPAVAQFLAGLLPTSRTAVVRGGSHLFAQERPDEVAALIRSHLVED